MLRSPSAQRPAAAHRTRTFRLVRHTDVSGVSGTGVVAQGAMWPDGQVAVHWHGEWASTTVWPNMDAVVAVHGHEGATVIEWDRPGGVV